MHPVFLRSLSLLLISGVVCLSPAAAAESNLGLGASRSDDSPEVRKAYELEKVGVTAKRLKEKVDSPYAISESSQLQTEVITQEDIEAIHPQTVWDILEQVPGFDFNYQGRQHQEISTSMRGGTAYGVILDGVYLAQLDRVIAALPVDSIESVTVVRDATALTLGPLASISSSGTGSGNSGFVILKTKRSRQTEAGGLVSYGSFNAEKYALYGGSKTGAFDYRVSGIYDNNPGREGWHMLTRHTSFLFSGGYTGSTFEAKLSLMTGYGRRQLENPLNQNGTWASNMDQTRIDPRSAALELVKRWSATQSTTFSYGYSGIAAVCQAMVQNSYSNSATLRHVLVTGNNTLKVGAQRMTYVTPQQAPTTGSRTDLEINSLFAADEYRMFGDRLTLDAGLRWDRKTYHASPTNYKRVDMTAAAAPAYSAGLAYKPLSRLTLTGRYAYTQNDPASYQVPGLANPYGTYLPTEKREKYEVGSLVNVHSAFNPWATVYFYHTKNSKTADSSGGVIPGTTTKVTGSSYTDPVTGDEIDFVKTVASATTRGIEWGASGRILRPLEYKVSWSYCQGSEHMASGSLRYQSGPFSANLNARHVGLKSQGTWYQTGNYTRYDANLNYGFKSHGHDAKLSVFGRNLDDNRYGISNNGGLYRDPGFTYGVQISFNLL